MKSILITIRHNQGVIAILEYQCFIAILRDENTRNRARSFTTVTHFRNFGYLIYFVGIILSHSEGFHLIIADTPFPLCVTYKIILVLVNYFCNPNSR